VKNKIFAWLNLAYRFAVHVLVRMPARALGRRGDYNRFRSTVGAEGYLPMAPAERERFPAFTNCIHCGLCSFACPELRAAPASAWEEAWTFVAGPSRSLDRAVLVAHDLTPCARCDDCAAVCPTGVPIPFLAATLQRMAGQADGGV
jgi:succinate dehydrogenase/fumarate reductase-like Fe-S protein